MDRKRRVSAAGALSASLVVASTGFAFASGVFGTGSADKVGSFPAMMARLTPETTANTPHANPAAGAPPRGATVTRPAAARGLLAGDFQPVAAAPTTARSAYPAVTTEPRESDGDDLVSSPKPPPEVSTTTGVSTTTVAHSGPSPVTGDDADDGLGGGSDD